MTAANKFPEERDDFLPNAYPIEPTNTYSSGESLHVTRQEQQRIAANVITGMLEQAGFSVPDLEAPASSVEQA
jgi:hypothetical protein